MNVFLPSVDAEDGVDPLLPRLEEEALFEPLLLGILVFYNVNSNCFPQVSFTASLFLINSYFATCNVAS